MEPTRVSMELEPNDDDRDLTSSSEEDVPTDDDNSSQEVGDDETPTDDESNGKEEVDQERMRDEEANQSDADTDCEDEDQKTKKKWKVSEFSKEFPNPTEYIANQVVPPTTRKVQKKTIRISHPITKEEKKKCAGMAFDTTIAHFVKENWLPNIEGLILGPWDRDYGTEHPAVRLAKGIKLLSQNKEGLRRLTGLFIGDIPVTSSSKLSWIQLCDVTPLLASFPNLTHLKIRGAAGLEFMPVTHENLRSLTIECTNMSGKVLRGICQSHFPNLERLELWLGTEEQDADWDMDDLLPLLRFPTNENRFPKLMYLGLKNTSRTNELIPELIESDLMDQLEVLDLSLGTLSNRGAHTLLLLDRFPRLKALNIQHHFCTDAMVLKIKMACPRLGINYKDQQPSIPDEQETDSRRYVAVPE